MNRRYTIKFKLKALDLYSKHSLYYTSKYLNINKNLLKYWEKQKEILTNTNKQRFRVKKRNSKLIKIDKIAADYIDIQRTKELPVNYLSIIKHLNTIDLNFKTKSENAKKCWIRRFLKRNEFVNRKACNFQKQSLNESSLTSKFYEEFDSLIESYPFAQIWNMDESPVNYSYRTKTTIERKGRKYIHIKKNVKEKLRVTAVLCGSIKGDKLKPLIIFKGKRGKTVEKRMKKYIHENKIDSDVVCQNNAWIDSYSMIDWVKHVFPQDTNDKILILDNASAHLDDDVKEELYKRNTHILYLPENLTNKLQPLDQIAFKNFKYMIKNNLFKHYIENNDISRQQLLNIIVKSWQNVRSYDIIRSFELVQLIR